MRSTPKDLHEAPTALHTHHSDTAGPDGPVLLQDIMLTDALARFNRERPPERVMGAGGCGAYGTFETTNPDLSQWTRMAPFAQVGNTTEVFVRFSTLTGSRGAPDLQRGTRGFAIKFFTDDGIWDLVAQNAPMFFVRDGMRFVDLMRALRGAGGQNLGAGGLWEFFAQAPEATHHVTWLYADRGIAASYRQMQGYSGHTFAWINSRGERTWVRFHLLCEQGVANFTQAEAQTLMGRDPCYLQHDLAAALEDGQSPAWVCKVQIMGDSHASSCRFDPFDVTHVWPHADHPLVTVGRLVLNRLPTHESEVEQAAFSPANMVPGIAASPDRLLQARLFAYGDAQRHRLGPSYGAPGHTLGPSPTVGQGAPTHWHLSGNTGRHPHQFRTRDDDFWQAGALYRLISDEARGRLVQNIAAPLAQVRGGEIVERCIAHLRAADPDYGRRVAEAVKIERS